jgi:hypothetical protein
VPLPTPGDRVSILRALCRRIALDPTIDLQVRLYPLPSLCAVLRPLAPTHSFPHSELDVVDKLVSYFTTMCCV